MKKIKSKLIYVNPSAKIAQKPVKSPSPDHKNRSKIQKTNSPAKQIEHYYHAKSNNITYYCTQDQKPKKLQQQSWGTNCNKVSSFSLNDSQQQIDLNSISQTIKLKSPPSLYHSSQQNQHSSSKKYFSSNINQQCQTPKAKNVSFKSQFPQNYEYQSQIKHNSYDTGLGFQIGYHSQSKGNQFYHMESSPNKKSKKKLELYTPMINNSKEKSTKDSPRKLSATQKNSQSLTQKFFFQESYKIEPPTESNRQSEEKDAFITELQEKLHEKDQQIKKMSVYMSEYEKLGAKNKKLQKEMKQILSKLIEMKQKKEQSLKVSRQRESHNQFHQDPQLNSQRDASSTHSHQTEQEPLSEIQRQNIHQQKKHKRSLTDDYIKIYDDLQSSSYLEVGEEEQTYKPNLMKYSEGEKKADLNSSPSSQRKMLSVGARLKESLHAKNQDFKASFDDSILLSSFSSEKLSNQFISPKNGQNKKYDFSKKLKYLKTQETQEGSFIMKDISSRQDFYDSFTSSEKTNEYIERQSSHPKAKILDQLSQNSQRKPYEQTTAKKSKVRYAIKKKPEQTLLSERNVDDLVETNKKLTSIIDNLMKSHDSMFQQVKRMSEKNQIYANKMTQIQQEFNQIKINFGQLTLSSQEILNSVKTNFGTEFSFKNTLLAIEQKVSKLYQSINENAKEIKRENSQKQAWLESNQMSHSTPYLSKITSFGKQSEAEKQEKKSRKQSGSEFKEPLSPSFTYLEESASFLTDSFKLSQTDRSNPSNSRFNYCSTVEDQISQKKLKQSSNKSSKKQLPKYEQESKILIIEDSAYGSSESKKLSNGGASQSIPGDSGRGVSQKSGTSKDKMRSENSEIRINFDDLEEDASSFKPNLEIIEHKIEMKSSNCLAQESALLMKSSFGPIIMKQMSRSEKGDSVEGQHLDQVHPVDFSSQNPQRSYIRPRENSSINIFFSSDSICKSSKHAPLVSYELLHGKTTEQSNESEQSSFKSGKCADCISKDEQIKALQVQGLQMRTLISEMNEQKDKLQKLIKSKISIIDNLEVSLKQLQSLSSLDQVRQKKQLDSTPIMKGIESAKIKQNNQLEDESAQMPWFKRVNEFEYASKKKFSEQQSPIFNLKPLKFDQIQDLLPISNYLSKQLPSDKIQNLKSIQLQIQRELLKQQELERQLHEKIMLQRGNTLDWTKGSFSKVDEFREESFLKTKTILIKLIGLIRQFISQGSQNIK